MEHAAIPNDLFDAENRALLAARAAHEGFARLEANQGRQALGDLLTAFERLLRETRRLVRRSDRAEREMGELNQRLQELANELEYRATHDPLTGVLNRAAVIEWVNDALVGQDLALIVLDIDHFKRVNDNFGHPTGDRVIVGVVSCLQCLLPPTAHIGRVGGEEFTVLLPGCDADRAEAVAESMRIGIAEHDFQLPDGSRVTASFGLGWTALGGRFDEAYQQADEALYVAKRGGRNQTVCAPVCA